MLVGKNTDHQNEREMRLSWAVEHVNNYGKGIFPWLENALQKPGKIPFCSKL